jgi:hypothetical protein
MMPETGKRRRARFNQFSPALPSIGRGSRDFRDRVSIRDYLVRLLIETGRVTAAGRPVSGTARRTGNNAVTRPP